jgi:protein-tyrosine sulfotransferase
MPHADPIFILGVMPRSGTNYLWDLICSHPDCAPAREPIHEDLFLQHAHLLEAYIEAVQRAWDPAWGTFADDLPAKLWASLGDGLISFLWVERSRRLVTKSPSVRNLALFFGLFPRARLLILIRDGRSAVQSAMATFNWDFDTAANLWAEGAEEIRQFDRAHRDSGLSYRIVRYEDLVDDVEPVMAELLDFLNLDRDRFDFAAAGGLPVRGSSAFFGPGQAAVNWEPVEKDAAFAPKERWREWDLSLSGLLVSSFDTSVTRARLIDPPASCGHWGSACSTGAGGAAASPGGLATGYSVKRTPHAATGHTAGPDRLLPDGGRVRFCKSPDPHITWRR